MFTSYMKSRTGALQDRDYQIWRIGSLPLDASSTSILHADLCVDDSP